ncbi:hypothetical protein [Metabacillus fastidiosus]|uniref:hypothetical protein n=1 Tax=Metabacillus fastidiosus TaxID=1458 RepID=UPI003D2AAF3F
MKDPYSIIAAQDGFYDLVQNAFNSDGTLLSQTPVKRYKSKSGARGALKRKTERYDTERRRTEGENFVKTLDLSKFKLLPNVKPGLFHYHTVRKNTQYLWTKKVRPAVLELQGKTCSICGWIPENDEELKKLHLHEIEDYDFHNVVCHLKDIDLICEKCHSFHHIARTKMHSTKEGWEDLLNHFVKVNDCPPEVTKYWTNFERLVFQLERERNKEEMKDLPSIFELTEKTVRYTVNPDIPFAEEMIKQLEKKGLLYQP